MLKYFLWPVLIIFIICGTVSADFYKWEDENGVIHITDYPPPARTMQKKVKVHKDYDEKIDSSQINRRSAGAPGHPLPKYSGNKSNPDVTLYTTSWCKYCRMARDFLQSRNINFTEYDVEKDKEANQRMRMLGGSGSIPFVVINGQTIQGYSEQAYENALRRQ